MKTNQSNKKTEKEAWDIPDFLRAKKKMVEAGNGEKVQKRNTKFFSRIRIYTILSMAIGLAISAFLVVKEVGGYTSSWYSIWILLFFIFFVGFVFSVLPLNKWSLRDAGNQQEKNRQKEKKQELAEKALYDIELHRTENEKYSYKRLSGIWLLGTWVAFLGFIVYITYAFFAEDFSLMVLLLLVVAMAPALIFEQDEEWTKRLAIKAKIFAENQDENYLFPPQEYDPGYIYTDSKTSFIFAQIAKIIAYATTLPIFIGLIFLVFKFLGSLSATTVIIVLLVIIVIQLANKK